MKFQFRETSPQDAPAVASFLQRIFDLEPRDSLINPQHLYWKSWDPRSDWPGSRGYVLVKENDIVAHGTVVPLTCVNGDQRIRMLHLIDWAADPKAVGSGVTLLKRITQMVDAVVVVGGTEIAETVLPAFGFRKSGEVTRFARPLRPVRRLTGQSLNARAGAQFARSVLWSVRAPAVPLQGWTSTRITADQLPSANIPWPRSGQGSVLFERTPDNLAYFLRCPTTPMELHAAMQGGCARGYFLLAHALGQARIVDFYVNSEDRKDWQILVQLAVTQAKRNADAVEVVSVGGDPVSRQALLDCGFHTRGNCTLRLLSRRGLEFPAGPIRWQMIDHDDAYLQDERHPFWA